MGVCTPIFIDNKTVLLTGWLWLTCDCELGVRWPAASYLRSEYLHKAVSSNVSLHLEDILETLARIKEYETLHYNYCGKILWLFFFFSIIPPVKSL